MHVLIEGMDKYSQSGYDFKTAASMIKNNIIALNNCTKKMVVVIDTCGESFDPTSVFGVNFKSANWNIISHTPNFNKDKLEQHLAWSLRNVLQRGNFSKDTQYYLNPISATFKVCIDVHAKKAKKIFNKIPQLFKKQPQSLQGAINELNDRANQYNEYLTSNNDKFEEYKNWDYI